MIKKILHKDIDRKKYAECLQNSENYRVYAEDWYLDVVAEKKWDCYVYRDYEAIMPIPFVKKIGIKIIAQPILCQQLGVFSEKIDSKILKLFEAKIRKNLVLNYHFNEENSQLLEAKFDIKNNFLLQLNKPYEELKSNFRRDRLKDIRRIEKLDFEINRAFVPEDFRINLMEKYPNLKKYHEQESFKNLLQELKNRNLYDFYEMKSNGVLITSLLICHSKNRRILLLSTKDITNNFKGAFAYLLNVFIEEHSNSDLILDFEGSMIESIADFNKSFGAENNLYFALSLKKIK